MASDDKRTFNNHGVFIPANNLAKQRFFSSIRGQSSTELAVFGAVLLFVIGAIVKQSLGFSYMQNQNLRALRMAMIDSYKQSEGLNTSWCIQRGQEVKVCEEGDSSRNSASVLVVEDRLASGIGKYGVIDRAPYINSASATHSHNLFQSFDAGETYNIPLQDVYVNGKHFVFSTASLKTQWFSAPGPGPYDWSKPAERYWMQNCVEKLPDYYNCRYVYTSLFKPCPPECLAPVADGGCGGCGGASAEDCIATIGTITHYPCRVFYYREYNTLPEYLKGQYCAEDETFDSCKKCTCSTKPDSTITCEPKDCSPIGLDEPYGRFDLNRDGVLTSDGTDGPPLGDALRKGFGWQWKVYMGAGGGGGDFSLEGDSCRPISKTGPGWSGFGSWGGSSMNAGKISLVQGDSLGKDMSVDVDDDGKLERILSIGRGSGTVATSIQYEDFQGGDVDYTLSSPEMEAIRNNHGDPPGLTQDVLLYSYSNPGTFFSLEQKPGTALRQTSNNRYIRTTQKKNRVDLIQRTFQLSNNTGVYCDASLNRTSRPYGLPVNPVEKCCATTDCCFWGYNGDGTINYNDSGPSEKTCYDTSTNKIFIRSRVSDKAGRKFITDISDVEKVITGWQ